MQLKHLALHFMRSLVVLSAGSEFLSFNGNKIITTSGGGALVCPDDAFAERARFLATPGTRYCPHYQHSVIGYNYRMSNVCAAIGRGQLEVLDQRVEQRRKNFAYYQETLSDLPGIGFCLKQQAVSATDG